MAMNIKQKRSNNASEKLKLDLDAKTNRFLYRTVFATFIVKKNDFEEFWTKKR